ncbi:MAG: GTP-dependent dephospho-CoA kinase family protein [Haloarculaceae archaeon]
MVLLELQPALRDRLKEPFGPVSTGTAAVLDTAGTPLVTVGDIVTYHVLEAGRVPDLALVDERTERAAVDDEVSEAVADDRFDRVRTVENPPATLTAPLLAAIVDGLGDGATLVRVDGEEDLAALPAIAAAPEGASVLYGQPDEGVVHVTVDAEIRERVLALLDEMDGDSDRTFDALGVARD